VHTVTLPLPCCAQTGSGKTCAFVLPLLVYIAKLGRITEETAAEGPMSVILAPSRELANQVCN